MSLKADQLNEPNNPMKNQLFPKYLNRLQYLARFVIFFVTVGVIAWLFLPVMTQTSPGKEIHPLILGTLVLFAVAVVATRILALDLPRIRSAGWNPNLLFLYFVPGVGTIIQICLFLLPPVVNDSSDTFPATSSGGGLANRIIMGFFWFVGFQMIFSFLGGFMWGITGHTTTDDKPSGYFVIISILSLVVSVVGATFGLLPGTKKKVAPITT